MTNLSLVSRIFVAVCLVTIGANVDAAAQVVDLGYAKYVGTVDATSHNTRFLGIRYGAPPIGDLRFQAPQPPATVRSIQHADTDPSMCLNGVLGSNPVSPFVANKFTIRATPPQVTKRATPASSEDCLFLNVFTPGLPSETKRKLPVVVWMHGGGYAIGGTSTFNGDDLVRKSNNGIIAVIIQYRLGLFGFLAGETVKKYGALNVGILDQKAALEWIQKHINKFGGDPSKVTVWGQSAGAGSGIFHMIAKNGTNPPFFRGLITSSSFLPSQYHYNDPIPEKIFNEVSSQANCGSATHSLDCLRSVDATTLGAVNINVGASAFFGTFMFNPVVDESYLTVRPIEGLRRGRFSGVQAVLAVTNTFEGAISVNASTAPTVRVTEHLQQLFPNFGPVQVATAATLYKDIGTPIEQVTAIMGEVILICPSYYLLRAFSGRSWKGEFAIPPGAHKQDIPYYFTSQNPNGIPAFSNADFNKAFPESYLNFVMSLDPNVKSDPSTITPRWDVWAERSVEMLFNKTETDLPVIHPIHTSRSLLDSRCKFWESVGDLTGQ